MRRKEEEVGINWPPWLPYLLLWLTLVDGSVAAAAANRTGNVRGHHFDVHTPVSLVSQGRRHAFGAGGLGR